MTDISIDEFCLHAAVPSTRIDGIVAEDARTYFDRGLAWAQIGGYGQALEAWKQAVRLAPDYAGAYAAIGGVYMTLGCWQEAAHNFEQAIQADPNLVESYYGLGSAYGHLCDYDRSIEAYTKALKIVPFTPSLHAEAVVACQECLTKDSPRPESDALQERLQSDVDGFDFSALMSSPVARRQAVRQEQAVAASIGEHTFGSDSYAPAHTPEISPLAPQFDIAAPAADLPEEEEEEWAETASPRDKGARAVLVVLLIVLGCMGGKMAITAVNDARDRAAYIAMTAQHSQGRRSAPPPSTAPDASTRESQ